MANYNPNLNFSKPIIKPETKSSFNPELELPPSFENVNTEYGDDTDIDEVLDNRLSYSFDSIETGIASDIIDGNDISIAQSDTVITALLDLVLNFAAYGDELPYMEETERNLKILWSALGKVDIVKFDAIFNTLVVIYDISNTEDVYDKMYDMLYT